MQPTKEMNRLTERETSRFMLEVDRYRLQAYNLVIDPSVKNEFIKALNENQIIIVGEAHEINETPNILYTLMETFSIRMLGCEITPEVGNLISTNNIEALSIFKHPNCSSGVLTAGHIPLIRSLKSPPVYFDYTKNDGFETDLKFRTDKMVKRFCSQYPLEESNKILITCGDSHAMLQEIIAGDQKFEPFALKLKERGYRVLPIKMHYKNGFTGYWRNWGNWDEDIPQEVDKSTPQTLEMTFENGFFTLKINNLHKGTVPNMLTHLEI